MKKVSLVRHTVWILGFASGYAEVIFTGGIFTPRERLLLFPVTSIGTAFALALLAGILDTVLRVKSSRYEQRALEEVCRLSREVR